MTTTEPDEIAVGLDILRLASRLLAREIDLQLYHALLDAELVDAATRSLGPARAMEELAVEYCRLFVGPRPACPPYASEHRVGTPISGDAGRRVKEFMDGRRLDLRVAGESAVLSHDHLAVELALLCHLLAESPRDDRAVRLLLEDHLLPWAPGYLRRLCASTELAPYSTVARLTLVLLA